MESSGSGREEKASSQRVCEVFTRTIGHPIQQPDKTTPRSPTLNDNACTLRQTMRYMLANTNHGTYSFRKEALKSCSTKPETAVMRRGNHAGPEPNEGGAAGKRLGPVVISCPRVVSNG
jgi:hypothetical protein